MVTYLLHLLTTVWDHRTRIVTIAPLQVGARRHILFGLYLLDLLMVTVLPQSQRHFPWIS